jgi:dienelactone hydrolase
VRPGLGVRLRLARRGARAGPWDNDPIFAGEGDIDAARELVEQAKDGELFLYPGDQHYFADSSLPSYDPDATALLVRRVLDFLRER